MAKKQPTHDMQPDSVEMGPVQRDFRKSLLQLDFFATIFLRTARPTRHFPVRAWRTFLKQTTACVAAISIGFFTCTPQAIAQQEPQSTTTLPGSKGVSVQLTAENQSAPTPKRPVPSAKQSAEARVFFRKGTEALRDKNSAKAIELFGKAHKLDPDNAPYLAAYDIAQQQLIKKMLLEASSDQKAGKTDHAVSKLQEALKIDPDNPYVAEHLQSFHTQQVPAVVETAPMPSFSGGIIELNPTPNRATFHLHADEQKIIQHVFQAYGVTAIFDDSVPTKDIRLDLSNVPFDVASDAVQLSTDTFLVPLDPQRVLVAKNTKENRLKFERLLLETIYLPGLTPKEMADPANLVKTLFDVKQVSVRPNNGTLSIRAPEDTLQAINATISRLFIEKPEVMLDVRVYQINDSRLETLGVTFPQQFTVFNVESQLSSIISSNQATITQLISSGLVNPGDLAAIAALLVGLGLANGSVLNQPFALFGNGLTLSGLQFGTTTANATLSIANTRELDHIQLRAEDSQEETFKLGSRYPVITQSYSAGTQTPTAFTGVASLLSGSTGTQLSANNPLATAPTVQYEDLGLTVKAKATILHDNNVEMNLQIKIAALAGSTVNGIPAINNRSFTTSIQVHDGGSALVTSTVSQSESKSLTGIPGLSELPGFGWTASPTTQVTVGDIMIVITPHVVSETHNRVQSPIYVLSPAS